MGIIFKTAQLQDIDAIMQIEEQSFVLGCRESKDLYIKRIKAFSDGFLVAQDTQTKEIGGYISSEIWAKNHALGAQTFALGHDPLECHTSTGTQFYITSFGILPSWRGRRVGVGLFEALEARIDQDFKSVDTFILIVSEKWTVARAIYQKRGYQEVGRIIDFFTPDETPSEDAIIMKKKT